MKNIGINFVACSFLLIFVSLQAMEDEKGVQVSTKPRTSSLSAIGQEAYKIADTSDKKSDLARAQELLAKEVQYRKFQGAPEYPQLAAAVLTGDVTKEKALVFTLMEKSGEL